MSFCCLFFFLVLFGVCYECYLFSFYFYRYRLSLMCSYISSIYACNEGKFIKKRNEEIFECTYILMWIKTCFDCIVVDFFWIVDNISFSLFFVRNQQKLISSYCSNKKLFFVQFLGVSGKLYFQFVWLVGWILKSLQLYIAEISSLIQGIFDLKRFDLNYFHLKNQKFLK